MVLTVSDHVARRQACVLNWGNADAPRGLDMGPLKRCGTLIPMIALYLLLILEA